MSEEELMLWWFDLPLCARVYYTGSAVLHPDRLPWAAFRHFQDMEARVYRPFNPDTMNWEEYKMTSDYLVHSHHDRKRAFEEEEKAREYLKERGFALADTFTPDMQMTMPEVCEGCLYQRPSQKDHACLNPDEEL